MNLRRNRMARWLVIRFIWILWTPRTMPKAALNWLFPDEDVPREEIPLT